MWLLFTRIPTLPQDDKAIIVEKFEKKFTIQKKNEVQKTLIDLVGKAAINSYVGRVHAVLCALPQEIRFILRHDSSPIIFESVIDATDFLKSPKFNMSEPIDSYLYQVIYSDGSEFEKCVDDIGSLRILHSQISLLTDHMNKLTPQD